MQRFRVVESVVTWRPEKVPGAFFHCSKKKIREITRICLNSGNIPNFWIIGFFPDNFGGKVLIVYICKQ